MAYFNRTEIGLKQTGTTVNVPDNPTARLMYYLSCVFTVLDSDDVNEDVSRLTRYRQYYFLSREDKNLLIRLCILLDPDVLMDKCFFQSDAMCKDSGNEFYEIETVRNNLLVAGSIMVGGRRRQVNKIMTFKMSWLRKNWSEPLKSLLAEQRRDRMVAMRRNLSDDSCSIM